MKSLKHLWIRLLLTLYPEEFRRTHGQELSRLAADAKIGLFSLSWDLASNALRVRLEDARDRKRGRSTKRSSLFFDGVRGDFRESLRSLRRRPAFTALFLATLALGIGANVAIFTVLHGVVLRPLAFPDPERVVRVWWRPDSFNQRILALFRERARSFEGLSGWSAWGFTLTGDGEPEEISGAVVSERHFEVLGVAPLLGRSFAYEEGEPGRSDVCILSEGLWKRRFGADEKILGRRIELSGAGRRGCTVVGVVADAHASLDRFGPREAFLPLERPLDLENDASWFLSVVGRLKPGVSLEAANAEVKGLSRIVRETMYPRTSEEAIRAARVETLRNAIVGGDVRGELLLLSAAAGVVLLLACGNLGALLVARYGEREREIAIRAALGAGRGRVLRRLWVEALVLGLLGGVLGCALAASGSQWLMALLPGELPRIEDLAADGTVLLFAVAASILSAAVFGLPPSLRASRGSSALALRAPSSAAGPGTQRLHRWLVGCEIACSLVLLTAAGLVLEGFVRLSSVEPGFEAERALVAAVSAPDGAYPDKLEQARLFREVVERLSALPGVERVGTIHILPLDSSNWDFPVYPEGRLLAPDETPPRANFRVISGSYFQAMGIPLLEGRDLGPADREGMAAVGMVNRSFARAIWPGESAVGKKLRLLSSDGEEFEIVGVVGDVRQHGLATEPVPEVYRPLGQWTLGRHHVVVRTPLDPASLAPSVREAIWSVDPNLPIVGLAPMEELVSGSIAGPRFVTLLLLGFAALALVLAAVGVYGVASAIAGSRRREIGIRMALGSTASSVVRRTLVQGMAPVAPGLLVGLIGSKVASSVVSSLVPKVPPFDPGIVAGIVAFLGVVALIACYLPARRASRLDPLTVLRLD